MLIKAYKVIQAAMLLPVLLCAFNSNHAQILFKNPSFEGAKPGPPFVLPVSWHQYSGWPGVLPDSTYYGDRTYKKAYNGLTYLSFDSGDSIIFLHYNEKNDAIYQTLPCVLKDGIKYHFSFYALSITYFVQKAFRGGGGLSIWLADDSLHKVQLIYRVFPLDTNWWQQYEVSFTAVKSLRNIVVEGYSHAQYGLPLTGCIDYLSPITFNSKDYLKAKISDTLIDSYKPIQLSCKAIEDSATYTWSSVPAGFTSTEQSPVANPTQTTTYIVTATFNCGLQVSDTVKVRVNIPKPPPAPYIQTYITNNGNWHIQNENVPVSVKIYDALGQLLYTDNNYQNTFNPAQAGLVMGVYFYVIDYNSGNEIRGKLVVVR